MISDNAMDGEQNSRVFLRDYLLVAVFASIVIFWALGADSMHTHEAYVAVTAANMADSDYWLDAELLHSQTPPNTTFNHWLIPVFNGVPRLNKTPLAYWLVAAELRMGFPLNDFTARMPTAIASVLLTLLVLRLGSDLFSRRTGLVSSLVFVTSFGVQDWGRNACVDMTMCFFIAAAIMIYRNVLYEGCSAMWLLAGGFLLGLGCLAKQFVPFLALVPMALMAVRRGAIEAGDCDTHDKRLRKYMALATAGVVFLVVVRGTGFLQWWHLVNLSASVGIAVTAMAGLLGPVLWYGYGSRRLVMAKFLRLLPGAFPGVVIALAMFVPWMWWISRIFPDATGVFAQQNAGRALGTDNWAVQAAKPFTGYYIWILGKWSLPWGILLPVAVAAIFRRVNARVREPLVFLLLWMFGYFLVLSAGAGKHSHYILPALPAACLLLGWLLDEFWMSAHGLVPLVFKKVIYILAALAVAIAPSAWLVSRFLSGALAWQIEHIATIALVVVTPLLIAAYNLRQGLFLRGVYLLVLALMLGVMTYNSGISRWRVKWADYEHFGRSVKAALPEGDTLEGWLPINSTLVYHVGRDVPLTHRRKKVLTERYGQQSGQAIWERRFKQSATRTWVIALPDDGDELAALGYESVLRGEIYRKSQPRILYAPIGTIRSYPKNPDQLQSSVFHPELRSQKPGI